MLLPDSIHKCTFATLVGLPSFQQHYVDYLAIPCLCVYESASRHSVLPVPRYYYYVMFYHACYCVRFVNAPAGGQRVEVERMVGPGP
jgi:hypothetical protein